MPSSIYIRAAVPQLEALLEIPVARVKHAHLVGSLGALRIQDGTNVANLVPSMGLV